VPELQRLRPDHAAAVLVFERTNRAYFATAISDRGDDYFEQFSAQYRALLGDQDAGIGAYHVLVADDGSVMGRFNLNFAGDGTAELGYRVAQHAAGRGGFVLAGRADPDHLGGKPGAWYQRDLAAGDPLSAARGAA
jgi:[ribosomal protein S5]-alanine N-acetyltransferase